jgi:hypothetical protein
MTVWNEFGQNETRPDEGFFSYESGHPPREQLSCLPNIFGGGTFDVGGGGDCFSNRRPLHYWFPLPRLLTGLIAECVSCWGRGSGGWG